MSLINFIRILFRKSKPEPIDLKFTKGQKVICWVTHEVPNSVVMNGVILGWAYKRKSYWAFSEIPSDWYRIRYVNGKEIILPQERMMDAKKDAENTLRYLESMKGEIGRKGCSQDAYDKLMRRSKQSLKFSEQ